MLNINEIKKFYPNNMHIFEKQLLREYLQYKILDIIFNSKFSNKIIFMGGTAIRIIYNSKRFSEDLDFDSTNMSFNDFKEMTVIIKKELSFEGFDSEIKTVSKNAFRCYVKFPKLLYNYKLSGYEMEKILIQLDAEKQPYNYKSEIYLLNKFPVNQNMLKDMALAKNIVSKMGYMCDKTNSFGIYSPKNTFVIDILADSLKKYKGNEWEALPNNFPNEVIELKSEQTELEKIWKIHDFLDYEFAIKFIKDKFPKRSYD